MLGHYPMENRRLSHMFLGTLTAARRRPSPIADPHPIVLPCPVALTLSRCFPYVIYGIVGFETAEDW